MSGCASLRKRSTISIRKRTELMFQETIFNVSAMRQPCSHRAAGAPVPHARLARDADRRLSERSDRRIRIAAMPHTLLRLAMPLAAALLTLLTAGGAIAAPRCTLALPGQTQRIAVGDTGRPMLLHLPRGFDAQTPAPIVFLLHGSGGTGAGILAESRLAASADRHGFIVAAPDAGIPAGKGFVWNIPGVPTTRGTVPGPHAANDTAYIETAIDRLVAAGCVDPARIYVTGLSGGGRMASWLGCVAADRIAAIAPVVGLRAG